MKRHDHVILNQARVDLLALAEYIAQDSPQAARRFMSNYRETIDSVCEWPKSNRLLDDLPGLDGMNLRRAVVKGFPNHLMVYRFDGEKVTILRAFHAAQDWAKRL